MNVWICLGVLFKLCSGHNNRCELAFDLAIFKLFQTAHCMGVSSALNTFGPVDVKKILSYKTLNCL